MLHNIKKLYANFIEKCNDIILHLSHTRGIRLRYKVEVRGFEHLKPKPGEENKAILFLSNHSSHLDGPLIASDLILRGLSLSIWALDLAFKLPYLRWVVRRRGTIQIVKVPNIPEVRSEKHVSDLHKLVTRTADGIRRGKNFLIFPAGQVKKTPIERIEGKSAVPFIIKQCPDVRIILVRLTGLWGSRFSYAPKPESRWVSHSEGSKTMLWTTLKMILLNGIFFIPKRKILIEYLPAGPDFPRHGSRLEITRYLEQKYNEKWGPEGEPLNRVPDYFWNSSTVEHEYYTTQFAFNLNLVPKHVRNAVVTIIADKANLDVKEIDFDMKLGRDIGLDSLQIVQVLVELEKRFNIKRHVPDDITTVGHLIAIAAKIPISLELVPKELH